MMITENKVNDKYKIKNNKTADNPDFLAIKNQTNANTSSSRNLRLIETMLCIVWLAGSLSCPLKKIIKVSRVISEKPAETATTSLKFKLMLIYLIRRNPAASIRISSDSSSNTGLIRGFKRAVIYL